MRKNRPVKEKSKNRHCLQVGNRAETSNLDRQVPGKAGPAADGSPYFVLRGSVSDDSDGGGDAAAASGQPTTSVQQTTNRSLQYFY